MYNMGRWQGHKGCRIDPLLGHMDTWNPMDHKDLDDKLDPFPGDKVLVV